MKYLCLAYYNESAFDSWSTSEIEEFERRAHAMDDILREGGHLVAQGSLQSTASSTCLRPKRNRVWITDGPFVEAEEQIGGFFIIDARDLNEAIRVASQHPAAEMAEEVGWGIEIRPMQLPDRV